MNPRQGKKRRFQVEALEGRIALARRGTRSWSRPPGARPNRSNFCPTRSDLWAGPPEGL